MSVVDEMPVWTLAAETKEWVGPISIMADGQAITTFEVSVTAGGGRPVTWEAPTLLGGAGRGVLVGTGTSWPLRVGQRYTVWTRFTDTPEVPVTKALTFRVV